MSYSRSYPPKLARKLLFAGILAHFAVAAAFAAGLPGEYLVTQRWRALNNQYSPLSNPANIAEENYLAMRAAVAPVLQGQFTLSEFGMNVPLSLYHTAGLTMLLEGAGAVFEDMVDPGSGKLIPNLDMSRSNMNMMFSGSYAWHIWQRLIVGANVNFAYQTNFGEPLMGIGFDIGINYRLIKHPILGEHIVGLATQNLLAPAMGYELFDLGTSSEYARNLRISGYSKFWESRIENQFEFDLKDFLADISSFTDPGKPPLPEWELNWRIGYYAMRMFKAYAILGFDDNILGHWGLALGAQLPSFNRGRDLSAFYQYNMMMEDNSDATSHSFYVKADFGKHREENMARRIARMASLNPNELYNRGRKLYSEGKYWDAFFVFSRLMVEFPDFFKNDWVSLFRSSCQEQLDMREQSYVNYNRVRSTYPTGEVTPHADLGLMRILYRNNDFIQATNQFVELNKPNVPDSLRHHGSYIMGQIYMQTGELRKAIHSFSVIPDDHPDYIFAQHATAITHAMLDSDMKEVITALENAMGTAPKTKEQQEMVNRSYLFMGFIFYEEQALSKAVVALRQVPPTSYYYEDALLGLGWTALKARQWNDCISNGQTLAKISSKPVLRCEGMLVQAYGHLLQKDYSKAIDVLRIAHDISQKLTPPDQDSLSVRTLQNDNNRIQYHEMSERVEEFSMIGQTSHLTAVLDSLKNKSNNFIKGFQEHQVYRHEFQRGSFFSRGMDQVNFDLEYAVATVQKIVSATGGAVDKDAAKREAEIEKIRKQMQQQQEQE